MFKTLPKLPGLLNHAAPRRVFNRSEETSVPHGPHHAEGTIVVADIEHRTTTLRGRQTATTPTRRGDEGYTIVELLLVVVILGILGSVTWLTLSGMTTEAADVGCRADRRQLEVAVEAYFAQTGSSSIPATGTGTDRHEQTLVDRGFLRSVSELHHVADDGDIDPEVTSC